MPIWSGCRVTIWDANDLVIWENDDCEVRIDDEQVLIDYFDDEGPVVLVGPNHGGRRFELRARSRVRMAVVELARDESELDGIWRERGAEGTWRIELDPAARSPTGTER